MVTVWDNKGETFDRYTVAIYNDDGAYDVYTMSVNASSPDGFNQYCGTFKRLADIPGKTGKINVNSLPDQVKRAIELRISGYTRICVRE